MIELARAARVDLVRRPRLRIVEAAAARAAQPTVRAEPRGVGVGRAEPASAEQRLRELARVEGLQVLELLADADEVDRRAALARERDHSAIAASTPPLAVPSSLVTTRPVSCSAASNACTCASAFWPVLPSITSSTSCGAPACALAITRLIFFSSSIRCSCVGRRPAVSAITTSQPRALPATTASNVTPAGSPPSWLTISTDRRRRPAGRRDRPRPRAARAPRRERCRPRPAAPSARRRPGGA